MIGLDYIALIVSSEESVAFYEKLKFKEIKKIKHSYDIVIFMGDGLVVLEIFNDPNHPERVSEPETKEFRHIAFIVENLDEVVEDLDCEEIRTDWFGSRFTFIFTKDPDGQSIELKERAIISSICNIDEMWVQEYK